MGIAKRIFRMVGQPRGRHGDDDEHPYEYAVVDEEESFSDGWYDNGEQSLAPAEVASGRTRRGRKSRRRRSYSYSYVASSARNVLCFFCMCLCFVRPRSRSRPYSLPIFARMAPLLRRFTLRRIVTLTFTVLFTLALGVLSSGIPPSYSECYELERNLPQHNLQLLPPEGESARFLRFPDHIWGHGLNNILQEVYVYVYVLLELEPN